MVLAHLGQVKVAEGAGDHGVDHQEKAELCLQPWNCLTIRQAWRKNYVAI